MREKILEKKEYDLNLTSIDLISSGIGKFLSESDIDNKEILRQRLVVESCLEIWGKKLGADTPCTYTIESSFGQQYVCIRVPGASIDPSALDDVVFGADFMPILSSLGTLPEYHYTNGTNIIKIWKPRKKAHISYPACIAMAIVAIIAIVSKLFFPAFAQGMDDYLVSPIYSAFLRMILFISGPMIFLSVVTSICSMGDMVSFGRIGKKVVLNYLQSTFILLGIYALITLIFYPVSFSFATESGNAISDIINMVFDAIPSSIVTPFETGNVLQILFISVVLGVTILFLSSSIPELVTILEQIQRVIFQIMKVICRFIPYFMCLAVIRLILDSSVDQVVLILKPILLVNLGSIFVCIIVAIRNTTKYNIPLKDYLVAIMPGTLISLTTASSIAALSEVMKSCTSKLGIENKLARFAVPMGNVLCKATVAIEIFTLSLACMHMSGMTVNVATYVITYFISGIIAIALPPVPGATLTCMSVMFTQLGIPLTMVPFGLSISLLSENVDTAAMVNLIQQEVYRTSKELE